MKKNHNKGFSLVELIVVVLIMAIIAVVLAPQVTKWVQNSRVSSDMQTLDSAASFAQMALTNPDAYDETLDNRITISIGEDGYTITSKEGSVPKFVEKFTEYAGIPNSDSGDKIKSKSGEVLTVTIENGKVATSYDINNEDLEVTSVAAPTENPGGYHRATPTPVPTSNPDTPTTNPSPTIVPSSAPETFYNITYNANTGNGADVTEKTNASAIFTVAAADTFKKRNSTLSSWNTKADGTGNSYTPGASATAPSDLTLYAQWTSNGQYTVSFDLADGEGSFDPITKDKDEDITLPSTIPTKAHNAFKNWTDGTKTYAAGDKYTKKETVTLVAQWEPMDEYTVTFNLDNGNGSFSSITKYIDEDVTLPSNVPTKLHYTFDGWKVGTTSSKLSAGATYTGRKNVELKATWKVMGKYNVTFDLAGGTGTGFTKIEKYLDEDIQLPNSEPTKSGMIFLGWSDGTTTYAKNEIYTARVTVKLVAQWKSNSLSVTHKIYSEYEKRNLKTSVSETVIIVSGNGLATKPYANVTYAKNEPNNLNVSASRTEINWYIDKQLTSSGYSSRNYYFDYNYRRVYSKMGDSRTYGLVDYKPSYEGTKAYIFSTSDNHVYTLTEYESYGYYSWGDYYHLGWDPTGTVITVYKP